MNECGSGRIASRTGCIVTYGGSAVDIVVNYVLLTLNVVACGWWLVGIARSSIITAPIISFIVVVAYQIGLCLALACSGISIVWCACIGWYFHKSRYQFSHLRSRVRSQQNEEGESEQRERGDEPSDRNRVLVMRCEIGLGVLNLAVLLYYGITTEIITTVAHFCALVLGVLISVLETYCSLCWYCCGNSLCRLNQPRSDTQAAAFPGNESSSDHSSDPLVPS